MPNLKQIPLFPEINQALLANGGDCWSKEVAIKEDADLVLHQPCYEGRRTKAL